MKKFADFYVLATLATFKENWRQIWRFPAEGRRFLEKHFWQHWLTLKAKIEIAEKNFFGI